MGIENCAYFVQKACWMDGWMDGWKEGWVGGWVGGWESGVKDCLQQSKIKERTYHYLNKIDKITMMIKMLFKMWFQ